MGCIFNSWTLTAPGTVEVARIGVAGQPDAAPAALITGSPTQDGNTVMVVVSPDNGCGTPGCRNGNSYQIGLRPEAGTARPTCDFRIDVKKTIYQP